MGKDLKGKEIGEGICQRANGTYHARFVDKFGKRRSLYDKDLRNLKKKLTDAKYEVNNNLNIVEPSTTLDQWFEKWMLVYKNDAIRPNTKRHYTHIFKAHISPTLGVLPISEITQLQIQGLINKKKKDGYQWETQNKIRVLLLDMFNRALQDDFVRKNPARGVRTASNRPINERRVLTAEEQALFFECSAGTFYHNMFVVAINTGLRQGEISALTWDDIDLDEMSISVTKTIVYQEYEEDTGKIFHLGDPKTKHSVRKVPINSACAEALKKQYVQKQIISRKSPKKVPKEFQDCLFTTKFNTPMNAQNWSDCIERIVNEINLSKDNLEQMERFSAHTFRHTFATRCIEAGVNPKTLQRYLGHATLQMTMDLYVHVVDQTKQEEMVLLEERLDAICISSDDIQRRFEQALNEEQKIIRIG